MLYEKIGCSEQDFVVKIYGPIFENIFRGSSCRFLFPKFYSFYEEESLTDIWWKGETQKFDLSQKQHWFKTGFTDFIF